MDDDSHILEEIKEKKADKSLQEVINKAKFSKYELDEVMMEA